MSVAGGPVSSTPKMILRSCMIFFLAITVGILVFFMIALIFNQVSNTDGYADFSGVMLWVLAGFSLLMLVSAKRQFAQAMAGLKNSLIPLSVKLSKYREALIRYMALCDAPVIFGIVGYMISGNFTFLVFSAVLLGFMLIMAPTRKRVIEQLGLDWQEQQELG